jgi:hypothetical protein
MALRAKIKKKNDMSKFKKILDYFTQGLPEFIKSYVIIRKLGILDFEIRYTIIRCIKQIQKYKSSKCNYSS